jgi:hypothetical protein
MTSKFSKSKTKTSLSNISNKKPPDTKTLPEIIGGPPESGGQTDKMDLDVLRRNSSLLIDIKPCKTHIETGISLFRLDSAWNDYVKFLKDVGYSPTPEQTSKKTITISAMAESFPTDTFSNEYGEHFLNQITDVAGQGFGQLAQMMGQKTATGAIKELGKLGTTAGSDIGGTLGNLIGGIGGTLVTIGGKGQDVINKMSKQGGVSGTIGKAMNQLLAGARIDFPQIWKNSSYNPTFSCSIRLYNPNPGSKSVTEKFIIAPLAAILTLALPQGNDENAYTWPFFCTVDCKGLFKIPMGAITNITVSKGGESGLVGFNQRVSMVDIRMDFVNLHSTILLSKLGIGSRPTLKGYLKNMMDSYELEDMYIKDDYKLPDWQTAKSNPGDITTTSNTATVTDPTSAPVPRVNANKQSEENNLIKNQPIIV